MAQAGDVLAAEETELARERVMVCVSGGDLMGRAIRAGRQMASGLHAEWVAVYVETPDHYRLPENERARIARALRLAQELGAETVILPGQNVAAELLRYAHAHGITKLVVGKPLRGRWQVLRSALADELVRGSGPINVFIVTTTRAPARWLWLGADVRNRALSGYLLSLVAVAVATLCGILLQPYLDPVNIALLYLMAIVLSATTYGLGPSILSSLCAVLLLDALFVPPFGLLSISGGRDLLTLGVFLLVSVVISELGARVRAEIEATRLREQQAAALYALSRDLSLARTRTDIVEAAVKQINRVFDAEATVWLADDAGVLLPQPPAAWGETEVNAARWAFEHGEWGGPEASPAGQAPSAYLPLYTAQGRFGVVGLCRGGVVILETDQRRLLETFAGQIAMALENAKLNAQAEQARVVEASDRFRAALLASISHDLRTPLASVLGAVTSLLDKESRIQADARQDLLLTIQEEATRLNRLVGNLLSMTRLESGALKPRREWQSLEEVIGTALAHVEMNGHHVQLDLAPDLPLAPFDFVLIEQVLLNLLDNAFKYAPPGSTVEIEVRREQDWLGVSVSDRGTGITPEEREHVFEKFYRGRNTGVPGTGLGLSICKGIVEAHGGTIQAGPRAGGGTCIHFTLPTQM